MNIIFLFPKNYKHGQPLNTYYKEIVSIMDVRPIMQDYLTDLFIKTELGIKFKKLSYEIFIDWKHIGYEKNENNFYSFKYLANPKIFIYYNKECLKYFHIPTYKEVKFDFYLLTGLKNNIINDNIKIINEKIDGRYIISLSNELEG